MTFKKKGWVAYGKKANSVDIIVKDREGNTLDNFRVYRSGEFDKNVGKFSPNKVVRILKEKYGFNFKIEKDWLEKDLEW